MDYKIVFSDIDGTLLDSSHRIRPRTLAALGVLQDKGIPFVLISARGPSCIYPILDRYGISCPIISYSGALIQDENRNILYSDGLSREKAAEIVAYVEENCSHCSWSVYSVERWLVKDRQDPYIAMEENIVEVKSEEGRAEQLPENAHVGKVLCLCDTRYTREIEQKIKTAFPTLSIVMSTNYSVEIMKTGTSKSSAIKRLCELWDIPLEKSLAFGDNYNDADMLENAGMAFLMGNAPEELKVRFSNITATNDEEGVVQALVRLGMI